MIRIILALFIAVLIVGCNNKSIIYFYSLDKSQCITVISESDERYVINGKHKNIPDSDYVKLHVKDRNSIWDNLYICWSENQYEWNIVVENSIVLESRLDSTRYFLNTELPKDDSGIPTDIKYRGKNCASYSFYLKKLEDNGAIIEYE
jgi:hypothetical protein